ncbi:hypothetical protein L208DRAFT_1020358, partial [Tricholoma matsutake]
LFRVGGCILIRIPVEIQIDGRLDADTATLASGFPPTTNAKSPQHFAFIHSTQYVPSGWRLEVFLIISFSRDRGALGGYRQVIHHAKETLIPLALSHQHPTPALFSDPLTIDGCSTPRLLFLHIVPLSFIIPDK